MQPKVDELEKAINARQIYIQLTKEAELIVSHLLQSAARATTLQQKCFCVYALHCDISDIMEWWRTLHRGDK